MTDHNDDQLAAWLGEGPAHGPATSLERTLKATRATRQRPAWLVALGGGTIASDRTNASVQLTWVVVALVALMSLLVGGAVVGGWLRPQPAPTVVLPSTLPALRSDLIAYTKVTELGAEAGCPFSWVSQACFLPRLWVSNSDGSGARELLPDRPGRQQVIAWSPNGSRLLFSDDAAGGGGLMLTDASGSEPQLLDACVDHCSGLEGPVFSPDGSQLAFVRYGSEEGASVIATMDLATGRVIELDSTRVIDPAMGGNDAPRWSPDGTQLVFARQGIAVPGQPEGESHLLVVNADGSNLRQLVPADLHAVDPDWSPNGSQIVFTSSVWNSAEIDPIVIAADIFAVRADGSGLRRLTRDGESARPNWTADGRIVYAHLPQDLESQDLAAAFELWIMDADGTGKTPLQADSAADLSAAGCTTCPYPPPLAAELFILHDAVWQPTP